MIHKVLEAYQLENDSIKKLKLGSFYDSDYEHPLINVYPVSKGKFYGFGGAITQASAKNYSLLSNAQKKKAIEDICGKEGLRYRIFRLCVGTSDFAEKEYCYVKEGDEKLATFSIDEDKKEIIPFIKDIISGATFKPIFFASPWSAPAFMKDSGSRFSGGHLKKDYYDLYAEYLCKFILAYKKEGIDISGLTIQNEAKAIQTWESCVFDVDEEIEFAKVLKIHLKKNKLDVKLFCWDHNKERLYSRAVKAFGHKDLFDGIGFHWYSGTHYDAIDLVKNCFPNKLVFESEFCFSNVVDCVESKYSIEHVSNLKYGANAIVEWNLILDENGGPFHNREGGCLAPLRFDTNTKKLVESSLYKETYMFSHFVDPEGEMLATSSYDDNVRVSAVKNPNGNIVINIYNNYKDDLIRLWIDNETLDIPSKFNSVITLIIK